VAKENSNDARSVHLKAARCATSKLYIRVSRRIEIDSPLMTHRQKEWDLWGAPTMVRSTMSGGSCERSGNCGTNANRGSYESCATYGRVARRLRPPLERLRTPAEFAPRPRLFPSQSERWKSPQRRTQPVKRPAQPLLARSGGFYCGCCPLRSPLMENLSPETVRHRAFLSIMRESHIGNNELCSEGFCQRTLNNLDALIYQNIHRLKSTMCPV